MRIKIEIEGEFPPEVLAKIGEALSGVGPALERIPAPAPTAEAPEAPMISTSSKPETAGDPLPITELIVKFVEGRGETPTRKIVKRILQIRETTVGAVTAAISNVTRKGRIRRVRRGVYAPIQSSFVPRPRRGSTAVVVGEKDDGVYFMCPACGEKKLEISPIQVGTKLLQLRKCHACGYSTRD